MHTFLLIISIICFVTGLIGCILPILPGLPISYLGLLLFQFSITPHPLSTSFLVIAGILTGIVMALDAIAPLLGAKLYGASAAGVWGTIIGMILGIFFFPPVGMIAGMILGAIVGELIAGKCYTHAVKTGMWSLLITILLSIIKFILALFLTASAVLAYLHKL